MASYTYELADTIPNTSHMANRLLEAHEEELELSGAEG